MKKKNEQGFARHYSESGFAAVLIMLILVGMVAIVGASYFFGVNKIGKNVNIQTPIVSPSPIASHATTGDMTNWKTYTNSQFGYTIKYSPSWKLTYKPSNPKSDITAYSDALLLDINDIEQILITGISLEHYKDSTLKSYLNGWASTSTGSGKIDKLSSENIETYYKVTTDPGRENIIIPIPGSKTKIIHIKVSLEKDNIYLDQILSTFKFTSSTSIIPKPISDLFNSINTKFNINLVPVEENEFYTTTGMISKKSWKIDFVNTNLGKGLTTFLYSQLAADMLESAGGAGGGVDAYENSQIKCNNIYGFKSGDPTNWKDPFNYLSCTEK